MDSNNCELSFANSAYLSELWAVRDLVRIRDAFPDFWTAAKDSQLRDEVRHARLLFDFIKSGRCGVIMDLKFSMQIRLYMPYVDLSLSSTVEEATEVHDLTERRAAWIYRTYLRHGRSEPLKRICREILADEMQHSAINSVTRGSPLLRAALQGTDRNIFRSDLPARYGRIMLFSNVFWSDYFAGANRIEGVADFIEPGIMASNLSI